MARLGFDKLTLKELLAAQAEIALLIESKTIEERETLRAEFARMAAENGFSVQELFGAKGKGGKTGSVPPKYRNPDNAMETWSGRGRQPLWLAAALKKGVKLEKFLIK